MPMNEEVRKAPPQNVADAVRIDYAPGELDRTAPERIWLQIDSDGDNNERDEPWPGDEVTWCADSIGGLEIQYIRADLLRAELTRLTEIADSVDPLVVRLGEVTTKLEELRQGYWDARAVMGFDNDGDPTPRAITSSFPALMASDAKSMRDDYDESLRESDRAESKLEAANALLRDIKEWDVNAAQGTCLMVPHSLRSRIQAHLSEPRT